MDKLLSNVTPSVGMSYKLAAPGRVFGAQFQTMLNSGGYGYLGGRSFPARPVTSAEIEALGGRIMRLDQRRREHPEMIVVFGERLCVLLMGRHDNLDIEVASDNRDEAVELIDRLEAEFGAEFDDRTVNLAFWTTGSTTPGSMRMRSLAMPFWAEIERNYPVIVRSQIQPLITRRSADRSGVIIWHGPPGTGKTSVVRAITREWRDWCSPHYIVDVERFLGADSEYFMEVLLSDPVRQRHEQTRVRDDCPLLLILEDAGHLIGIDTREQAGNAIARLLNMADGLIGQARAVNILITTNEPLGRLHPALLRPGRCTSRIEFREFTASEASKWLDDAEYDGPYPLSDISLADLYATIGDIAPIEMPVRGAVGFA